MTAPTEEQLHKAKLLLEEPVAMAKQRLIEFADSLDSDYTELMSKAEEFQKYGEYWNEGERFEGQGIYDGFWEDYELVTQTTVPPDNKYGFFTCSC